MDRSNDKNRAGKNEDQTGRDLPGYPHYPPDEDIMNPQTGYKKINADDELANSKNLSRLSIKNRQESDDTSRDEEDDLKIVRGTEADVTKEDIELLGAKDGDLDLGDDELVQAKSRVDDVEGEGDLDIPGADLDDESEELGEEDEENNYYSLGGDRHDNLEEDQS